MNEIEARQAAVVERIRGYAENDPNMDHKKLYKDVANDLEKMTPDEFVAYLNSDSYWHSFTPKT